MIIQYPRTSMEEIEHPSTADLSWIDRSLWIRWAAIQAVEDTISPHFKWDGSLDWCMPEARINSEELERARRIQEYTAYINQLAQYTKVVDKEIEAASMADIANALIELCVSQLTYGTLPNYGLAGQFNQAFGQGSDPYLPHALTDLHTKLNQVSRNKFEESLMSTYRIIQGQYSDIPYQLCVFAPLLNTIAILWICDKSSDLKLWIPDSSLFDNLPSNVRYAIESHFGNLAALLFKLGEVRIMQNIGSETLVAIADSGFLPKKYAEPMKLMVSKFVRKE